MPISDVTRRAIFDELTLREVHWAGRLEDDEFLARLYDLASLPSTDGRFSNAAGDIWQHRVNNPADWESDWVFYDDRFGLMHGDDETFLRFPAETIHPVVRRDVSEASELAATYNAHLLHDGYELSQVTEISGRPVFAPRGSLSVPTEVREVERASPIASRGTLVQQITRMEAAIESDPELAIGTAKELIETCCKTILHAVDVTPDKNWKLPRFMHHQRQRQYAEESNAEQVRGPCARGRRTRTERRSIRQQRQPRPAHPSTQQRGGQRCGA